MSDNPTAPATAQPGETIRAKWTMDGAATLADAAQRLEDHATRLRSLHEQGWTLTAPVEDDYGHLRDPDGNAGWLDEDPEAPPNGR